MSTWNNRVLRYANGNGFGIHEFYYKTDGMIEAWTVDAPGSVGHDYNDLRSDYDMKSEAFRYPVLDEEKLNAGERDPQKAIWQPPQKRKGLASGTTEQVLAVGATWSYRWYVAPDAFNSSYEHVPMLRPTYNATLVQDTARNHPGIYWLFLNEPDYYRQDNVKPVDAARFFEKTVALIDVVDRNAKFIVGGMFWVTNTAWLDMFFAALTMYKDRIAGIHAHHYADPTKYTIEQWRNDLYVLKRWVDAKRPGNELWLTEFGCLTNPTIAERVVREQAPWVAQQDWITRYAWYSAYSSTQQGSLFVGQTTTTTTVLGDVYKLV